MSDTITLQLRLPKSNEPGFLRRQRDIARIQTLMQAGDLSAFDKLVDILLPFVTEPADREAATNALLDASQDELMAALTALGNPQSQPEQSAVNSDAG